MGSLAGIAAMAALGASFPASAALADQPVATSQALRYGMAALVLSLSSRGRLPRPSRGEAARLAVLAATGLAGFNWFLLEALRNGDPAGVGAVVGCVPVVLALGAAIGRRRFEPCVFAAAAAVAAGAALVQGVGGTMAPAGVAYSIGALACEAAFSLLAAPLIGRLGPVGVTVWASALAVPMLTAAALAFGSPMPALSASELAALAYLGLVVTAGAFCLWYFSIARLGVDRAGLLTGAVPVSALLAAVALGQSQLTLARVLGVSAVAAGIALGCSHSSARSPRTSEVSWGRRISLSKRG